MAQNTNLLEAIAIMKEKEVSALVVSRDQIGSRASFQFRSRNEMVVNESQILGFVFQKDIFQEMIKTQLHDQDLHFDSV